MRILLDENLPADFAALLAGHRVDAVPGAGWAGIQNGKLLQLADERYDVFVTMDRSVPYQQNLSGRKLRTIVLRAPSNRMLNLQPLVPAVMEALRRIKPGQLLSAGP